MSAYIGLESCRILRPPHGPDSVEITLAAAAPRLFPTRVSQTLGICLKSGPDHTRVDVQIEAGIFHIEVFGAVHVRDRNHYKFELQIHDATSLIAA